MSCTLPPGALPDGRMPGEVYVEGQPGVDLARLQTIAAQYGATATYKRGGGMEPIAVGYDPVTRTETYSGSHLTGQYWEWRVPVGREEEIAAVLRQQPGVLVARQQQYLCATAGGLMGGGDNTTLLVVAGLALWLLLGRR
jgi:hypothetical protein